MPIFEYACESCDHRFEKLVFSSAPEVACPSCKGTQLRKLFSVFASVSGGGDGGYDCAPMPSFGDGGSCGRCGSTEARCE